MSVETERLLHNGNKPAAEYTLSFSNKISHYRRKATFAVTIETSSTQTPEVSKQLRDTVCCVTREKRMKV